MEKLLGLAGLFVFLLIAWSLSSSRKSISWRLVVWGVGLQALFAVVILKTGPGLLVFDFARVVMTGLLDFTDIGSRFLFGSLTSDLNIGAVLAFKVLPVIIFVSSLMGILYYLRVIQLIVAGMAWVMERTMKASGIEAFMAAVFVFMGIEAVSGAKEYFRRMTASEVFAVMTAFMSTIAGSVMAVYASFGASAGHLLAASVMSAPAALVIAKLMMPETERAGAEAEGNAVLFRSGDSNIIEAAANGASEGVKLAATIGAMLLAFVALIGMANHFLGLVGTSFEEISGYVFTPFAFLMGVPWEDCFKVGELLGIKIVFNEFISYQRMQGMIEAGALQPRSVAIATYALCSFANFGSIAILIGGIGSIAPERKKEIARLSLKALAAGVLASFTTATIAGMLL
ncbi:MAG: NupC/NupG family nucleoside CNT transporter [Deltaproteobacteria bacterium]|nr:NupC/NupG family nucleoside CNT transporter [Deltaproteobacteria bacterium]MCL4874742.1 NupC/NupG family nucleoside CNT transporter [bacterium]